MSRSIVTWIGTDWGSRWIPTKCWMPLLCVHPLIICTWCLSWTPKSSKVNKVGLCTMSHTRTSCARAMRNWSSRFSTSRKRDATSGLWSASHRTIQFTRSASGSSERSTKQVCLASLATKSFSACLDLIRTMKHLTTRASLTFTISQTRVRKKISGPDNSS